MSNNYENLKSMCPQKKQTNPLLESILQRPPAPVTQDITCKEAESQGVKSKDSEGRAQGDRRGEEEGGGRGRGKKERKGSGGGEGEEGWEEEGWEGQEVTGLGQSISGL